MSILIKGMKMPTARDTLVLVQKGGIAGGAAIVYEDEAYVTTAVPVPPHGRLIDADALTDNCMKEDGFLAEMLFRKVSNAPTIIEAEEEEE